MSKADQAIQYGLAEIGSPYVWGAEGPDKFDCSGLMLYILAKVGVKVPRTAREQQAYATPVSAPKPGDLVFWGAPAYHVAMYVGDNRVLTAPRSGERVRLQEIWGRPTFGRVPGLGSGNPIAGAAAGAILPVGNFVDDQLDKIGDFGKLIIFAGGGAVLVILGLWRVTKGSNG